MKKKKEGVRMNDFCQEIRQRILQEIDLAQELSDEELNGLIGEYVNRFSREHILSLNERQKLEIQLYNSFRRLDILQELLDDPDITEILVNGAENIFYEKAGRLHRWEHRFDSEEKLGNLIQTIVGRSNRSVNEAQPIVDTRLPDGSRVNVVLPPVSVHGACLSIRRFSGKPMTMERLLELHSLSAEVAEFLELLVKSGYNIFVSGGTGSGKTTFLNALSAFIPADQRVITIEDSAELQLNHVENLVCLETRQANMNGVEEIAIRDLIRTSLRMRPDRIIVGEVRGPEALDMLQAINTGHNGSMSTGHANSIRDMLSRLETMVLMGMDLPVAAIRDQISHGLDVMVHLGRLRDHSRKLLAVDEVCGMKDGEIVLNPLYRFVEEGEKDGQIYGRWEKKATLENREKLRTQGLDRTDAAGTAS